MLQIFFYTLFALFATVSLGFAQDPETLDAAQNPETLDAGIIASFGKSLSARDVQVDSHGEAPGDVATIIVGQITRTDGDKCDVVVTNTAESGDYRIRFRVLGTNKNGKTVMKRSYSAKLKAGESVKKTLACKGVQNTELVLKSGTLIE